LPARFAELDLSNRKHEQQLIDQLDELEIDWDEPLGLVEEKIILSELPEKFLEDVTFEGDKVKTFEDE
jgi:hypothetical protein